MESTRSGTFSSGTDNETMPSTSGRKRPHIKVVRKQPKPPVMPTEQRKPPKPRQKSLRDKDMYDLPDIERTPSEIENMSEEESEEEEEEEKLQKGNDAKNKKKSMKSMYIILIVSCIVLVVGGAGVGIAFAFDAFCKFVFYYIW